MSRWDRGPCKHAFIDTLDFLLNQLPSAQMRVLELGCGRGALALALDEAGYDVVAIDPVAPEGSIFRQVMLEELAEPGPFGAVVASRSLHHVGDLAAALDRIAGLLVSDGLVILEEFAWDRLDEPTAEWYRGQQLALHAAGRRPQAPGSLDELVAGWNDEHAGLHGGDAMRAELGSRFEETYFAWRPYLYRDLDGVASEGLESSLIEAGAIRATGFRYVGRLRTRR